MKEPHELAIAGYLAVAAGIPHPWRATQYRIDEVAAMVHVWITRQPPANVKKKRSWFGLLTAACKPLPKRPLTALKCSGATSTA